MLYTQCIYKNIRLYFYSWWWYLCGAEKQSQRVWAHEEVVGRRKSQWTTDFSQNSGTYIIYNSHVTCSNSSFLLVRVTPTFHFCFSLVTVHVHVLLVSHWPLAQLTSMGRRICHQSLGLTTSIGQGDIPIITLLILSSAGWSWPQHPPI